MDVQTQIAIPESVDLGEVLDSCMFHSPNHFVDALVHDAFPDYFPSDCKFWGSDYGESGASEYLRYHFARGFPEQGVVAAYSVTLRDDEGERINLPSQSRAREHFARIKGIAIDARLKLGRGMQFRDGGITSFYPVGGFEHPILGDKKYFTALGQVITSLLPKRGLAQVEAPIAKLVKFEAAWELPPRDYVALQLGVPDPTYERVERATQGFIGLCKYCMINADEMARAVLLTHAALSAKATQQELESKCGEVPKGFAKDVDRLYATADRYIKSLQAPELDIWSK